jgi:hypothetical protein
MFRGAGPTADTVVKKYEGYTEREEMTAGRIEGWFCIADRSPRRIQRSERRLSDGYSGVNNSVRRVTLAVSNCGGRRESCNRTQNSTNAAWATSRVSDRGALPPPI